MTPQSTQATTPTKTPEELQREVGVKKLVRTGNEFTWGYPWYRLHFILTVNDAEMDVGYNSILLGGESVEYHHLDGAFPSIVLETNAPLEDIAAIVQAGVTEGVLDALGAAATVVAVANLRLPFGTGLALASYAVALSGFLAYAGILYASGARDKAKAFLIGFNVSLFGVTIAAFVPWTVAFIVGNVFSVIGVVFSSIFDTGPLMTTLHAASAALFASICVGMLALVAIPEPRSIAFKTVFPLIALVYAAVALDMVNVWCLM